MFPTIRKVTFCMRPALYVLVVLFAVSVFTASAQTSPEVFRYRSSGFDTAQKTTKDPAGNIYIAASIPRDSQQTAFAVLKYTSEGSLVWAAHHDAAQGAFAGAAEAVSVDSAGSVYAAGYVYRELNVYAIDFLVVKFNSDGVEQWSDRITNGRGLRVIAHPAGGVYVTGSASSETGTDWLTIKYGPDGTRLWERRLNSVSAERPRSWDRPADMALDTEGNVVITGRTGEGVHTPADITTVKYDQNGDEMFRANYNDQADSNDFPFDMDVDPRGGVWVTGLTQIDPYSPYVPVILKYAPKGGLVTTIRNEAAGGLAIDVDSAGDVFVAGFSGAAKFDNSGLGLWERPLTFPAVAILADSAGFCYVGGSQQRFGTVTGDYMTVLFDPMGNQIFQHTYNGIGNGHDVVSDILFDNSENLFVVGTARIDSTSFEDIVILKFIRGNIPAPQPLGAPSDLTAIAYFRRQISIRWQDNASSEDGFQIERCQGSSCTDFIQIAEVGANVTRFDDTGLSRNTFYTYRVRAFNADGNSEFSNIARVRTTHH